MSMSLLIMIPVIASIFIYKLPSKLGLCLLWLVELFLLYLSFYYLINTSINQSITEILGGNDPILYISLIGSRNAFVFITLTSIFLPIIHLYALKDSYYNPKFKMLTLVLQGVINGLFLTNDLFNLFVLFEVSTVVLVLLVMFQKTKNSIFNTLYFIVIQVVSMTFFLLGIAYIYRIFGILAIDVITERIHLVPPQSLIMPAALMFTGLGVKLGFFPMFSWIKPTYMSPANPIVVQAIQSGLFIKVSAFIFSRLIFIYSGVSSFHNLLLVITLSTSIIGIIKALSQKNLSLILAFSTVSQVGLISAGFLLSDKAYYGSLLHMINHAFFKALLFLAIGLVTTKYKTTNIDDIRGVLKNMPIVGIMIIIGILSVTGAPLFNGYISKYMIMDTNHIFLNIVFQLINFGTIVYFIRFSSILFGQSLLDKFPISFNKKASLIVLSILILVFGLFGIQIVSYLFDYSFTISIASHIEKTIIYIIMLVLAYYLNKHVLSSNDYLYQRFNRALSLNNSIALIIVCFMVFMIFGLFFYAI